jgi:hypothetical protein
MCSTIKEQLLCMHHTYGTSGRLTPESPQRPWARTTYQEQLFGMVDRVENKHPDSDERFFRLGSTNNTYTGKEKVAITCGLEKKVEAMT